MATSFAYQPPAINTSFHPSYYHNRSTYASPTFTPPSGTPPSSNASPTSINAPAKQIYGPRHCGYIPAALRPTEIPARYQRPTTSQRGTQDSLDSQLSQSTIDSKGRPITPTDDFNSFIAPFSQVSRVVTDEWVEDLGDVTGAPTKTHWKPDSSTVTCTSAVCATGFSFLSRRHHCRRCGGIFCNSHSARMIPLDQLARFHPKGAYARSCDDCWNDYKIWSHNRKSRTSSIASGSTATPVGSLDSSQLRAVDILGIKPKTPQNMYAAGNESVQDYNWSTF